jgi:hypothetical protein
MQHETGSAATRSCRYLLLLCLAVPAAAVIVDGVAITIGTKVITRSEIDLRIRLTSFQNGEKTDFSLASRRQAAEKLIEQKLIEREMDVGHYPRLETSTKKDLFVAYGKTNYASNPAAMAEALRSYGLTPEELEDELGLQADLLTFLNLRFRPAVQVTDQDVQKYFTEHFSKGPEKTKEQAEAGALDEMRARIEQNLTAERANAELDTWLQDQRKRTAIVYVEQDLAPEGQPPGDTKSGATK